MKYVCLLVLFIIGCGTNPEITPAPMTSMVPSPIPSTSPSVPANAVSLSTLCGACVPANFPEYFTCSNKVTSGIYSDGSVKALTPGSYSGYGVNCHCTISIEKNCSIEKGHSNE